MRNTLFIIPILLLLFACKNKNTSAESEVSKDTLVVKDNRNINAIGVTLTPEAQDFVDDWKQYVQFDTFITRYYAISNSEALHNAKELSKMATELKDSIKLEISELPSTLTRFNILDNECRRLADMSSISAITPAEVSFQIKKILEAYSGVNAKLNTIFALQNMESELQLDPDFQAVLRQVPEPDKTDPNKTTQDNKTLNTQKSKDNSTLLRQQKALMRTKEEQK